jgi:hypothetical protein
MKKTNYFCLMAFLFLMGCSKDAIDPAATPGENQLKSTLTASPIAPWGSPSVWDDNVGVLRTALWAPPFLGPLPNYSFTQFPDYDFRPYFVHGQKEYDPANYDVMAHFGYISPAAVKGAVVEFTFRHIKYFLPHMNNLNQQRIYMVENEHKKHDKFDKQGKDNRDSEDNDDDETVITCTTDLVQGMNPMFCFLVKVDCEKEESDHRKGKSGCGKEESGLTIFWTDMKVNGVSVKGPIKNKVFACN